MAIDHRAVARQHASTVLLMGVDFLPNSPRAMGFELDSTVSQAAAVVEDVGTDSPPVGVKVESPKTAAANGDHQRLLNVLRERHDDTCPHCSVVKNFTHTVFGEGDPNARLMFIGEAPGEDEDRTGRPFVGKAGQKLDEIIKAMKMRREDVYIANVLKVRPPENRTPLPDEVAKCSPFLHEQIQIIRPEVIVALGNPATKMLLQTDIGITRLRGQWGTYSHGDMRIPLMPTFHPAYLLRNYTVDTRQKMWNDMQMVLQRLQASQA